MTTTFQTPDTNAEAIAAWDGPLYDRFVQFRDIVTTGLGAHGEQALRLYPPRPAERVLDVGCGFGDTTQRIARLVGPGGEAVLERAGFTDVTLRRCDQPITIGADIDEAIDFLMALGPAGEILRLQGDRAAHLHDDVKDALTAGLADLVTPAGVIGQASTWIVNATTPGEHDA